MCDLYARALDLATTGSDSLRPRPAGTARIVLAHGAYFISIVFTRFISYAIIHGDVTIGTKRFVVLNSWSADSKCKRHYGFPPSSKKHLSKSGSSILAVT